MFFEKRLKAKRKDLSTNISKFKEKLSFSGSKAEEVYKFLKFTFISNSKLFIGVS